MSKRLAVTARRAMPAPLVDQLPLVHAHADERVSVYVPIGSIWLHAEAGYDVEVCATCDSHIICKGEPERPLVFRRAEFEARFTCLA